MNVSETKAKNKIYVKICKNQIELWEFAGVGAYYRTLTREISFLVLDGGSPTILISIGVIQLSADIISDKRWNK